MERNSLIFERYLLRGAPNARDLGGLPTMDGRKVRAGVLLRSGELARITDDDAQTLSQYPLRTVVDFRTDLEREQKPDRRITLSSTTGSFSRFCSRRRTGRCSTTAPRGRIASASARCCCSRRWVWTGRSSWKTI